MVTLTDQDIEKRADELHAIVEAAQAELAELDAVRRVMARLAGNDPPAPMVIQPAQGVGKSGRVYGLTEGILSVLKSSWKTWLTAQDIQGELVKRLGREVPMSSISPKLSDLKAKGTILRDDMKVALKERIDRKLADPVFAGSVAKPPSDQVHLHFGESNEEAI